MSYWKSKPPAGTQIDRGHPLARSLVGAWLSNENAGVMLNDLIGGNHAKVGAGTFAWSGCSQGIAPSYSSARCDCLRAFPDVPSNTNFTMFGGFCPGNGGLVAPLYSRASTPVMGVQAIQNTGAFLFRTRNNASSLDDLTSTPYGTLTVGKYYTVAGTWSAGSKTLYVDGVSKATSTSSGLITGMTAAGVGGESVGPTNSVGKVVVSYYWNRTLSASEIAMIHADPYCMMAAPPMGRYNLWNLRKYFPFVDGDASFSGYIEG